MLRLPSFLVALALAFAALAFAESGTLALTGSALAQDGGQGEAVAAAPEGKARRARPRRRAARAPAPDAAEPKPAGLPPGMQQAAPVVTFGDWNVFTNGQQGKSRVCYAIAQPQARTPNTLARDTGYLFVTVRKSDNTQNEIAVMFGFKPKPAAAQTKPGAAAAPNDPYLALGSSRFGLVVKDENAWVLNQTEEARIVTEMSKTPKATVKTTALAGGATSDEYALAGFPDALKRAREECGR